MPHIFPGRYTANLEQPFVVFLIGMRINNFFAPQKWIPTARAMVPMLTTLFKNPGKGMLSAHAWIRWREVMVVQYWKSFDALESFARSAADPHLPAWKKFNQSVGADGSVGIWHETYLVGAKQYECVYGNMPRFGLASAGEHVAAIGNRETARLRIGGNNEPAVPSPRNPDEQF
jgi:hypothetical protein